LGHLYAINKCNHCAPCLIIYLVRVYFQDLKPW